MLPIQKHIILLTLSLTPILTWNYRHAIGALLLIFPSLPSIISSFMVCLKIESDPDPKGIFLHIQIGFSYASLKKSAS